MSEVALKELESSKQQLAAEAQTESSSLREEVDRQLSECASLRAALCTSEVALKELESSKQQLAAEAQTESSSLREEVGRQLAECTSLRAALCQSEVCESSKQQLVAEAQTESSYLREEVALKELESSKQQLAAEAQTEASSLREEVGRQLEECAALRAEMSQLEVAKKEPRAQAEAEHAEREPAEEAEPAEDLSLRHSVRKVQTAAVKLEERPLLGRRRSAKDYQRRAAQVSLHHKHRAKPAELKLVVATFVEQRTEGVGFQCALLRFNSHRTELSCWGQNDKGQLGQGDTLPRPTQQAPVLLGAQVVQISSGAYHSCALLQTGQVKCWGANNRGQLGLGDSANRGDDPKEMGEFLTPVGLGPCKAVEVRLGLEHSCARLDDGRVKCWGANGQGQARTGGPASIGLWPWELGEALVPEPLGTGRRAIGLLAGSWHSCAILDDQTSK
eukprot:s7920_g1.t7